uniref:CSON004936 protein n=1 Tax=Culicoides sonorensis TaxID=179676 RepID=A0A336LXC5_CULSO
MKGSKSLLMWACLVYVLDMTCLSDARNAAPINNNMEYDIVVQGPNGNGRISRSVITKDVNPEEVFPSEYVFRAAEETEEEENVAVANPSPANVQRGFQLTKQLQFQPLNLPAAPNLRTLDREELRKRMETFRERFAGSLPAPAPVALPAPVAPAKPNVPAPQPVALPAVTHLDLPALRNLPAPPALPQLPRQEITLFKNLRTN